MHVLLNHSTAYLLNDLPLSCLLYKVSELNVVLDSGVLVNTQGYLDPLLEYMQNEPSAAYSPQCSEVRSLLFFVFHTMSAFGTKCGAGKKNVENSPSYYSFRRKYIINMYPD